MPTAARRARPPMAPPPLLPSVPPRPPRILQVVRHPRQGQADAPIDWSRWYLKPEDDMGESLLHFEINRLFVELLRNWLAERGDTKTFAGGNTFFQWIDGEPDVQISPDAYTLDRVPRPLPDCIQTWLPHHLPPRFALETVSARWRKDYADNPKKYAHLGCRELAIYDPEHDGPRHSKERVALQIFRRSADGQFMRVYAGDGPALAIELGAWLIECDSDGGRRLRLARDPAGAQWVPTLAEVAERERARAQNEAQRAQNEAQRAQSEAQRAQAAEAEVARLQELLAKMGETQ